MTGRLMLLKAGDWVARRSAPRFRYYLDQKTDRGIKAINHGDPEKVVFLSEGDFACGAWKVMGSNPDVNATVLGGFNEPERA